MNPLCLAAKMATTKNIAMTSAGCNDKDSDTNKFTKEPIDMFTVEHVDWIEFFFKHLNLIEGLYKLDIVTFVQQT